MQDRNVAGKSGLPEGAKYAAFPDGIPDGTPPGTFLGRQVNALFGALGFDFRWFSNGFGFGLGMRRDTPSESK